MSGEVHTFKFVVTLYNWRIRERVPGRDVRGSVHHSTIHTDKNLAASSNLNVQQPFTYAKPEAASAVLSS